MRHEWQAILAAFRLVRRDWRYLRTYERRWAAFFSTLQVHLSQPPK